MFLPITGSILLLEYEDLQNFVQIRSGYNLVYLDRSYVEPVTGNTSFSAKKTKFGLVGADAYENIGRAQVNKKSLVHQFPRAKRAAENNQFDSPLASSEARSQAGEISQSIASSEAKD